VARKSSPRQKGNRKRYVALPASALNRPGHPAPFPFAHAAAIAHFGGTPQPEKQPPHGTRTDARSLGNNRAVLIEVAPPASLTRGHLQNVILETAVNSAGDQLANHKFASLLQDQL